MNFVLSWFNNWSELQKVCTKLIYTGFYYTMLPVCFVPSPSNSLVLNVVFQEDIFSRNCQTQNLADFSDNIDRFLKLKSDIFPGNMFNFYPFINLS